MTKSHKGSMQQTLVFAATLAALGVSVGVPIERALAGQPPGAYEKPGPDASQAKMVRNSRAGAVQMKERAGATQGKYRTGATQGKYRTGASQLKWSTSPGTVGGVPAVQVPAVQK